jgi:hypothetical protein
MFACCIPLIYVIKCLSFNDLLAGPHPIPEKVGTSKLLKIEKVGTSKLLKKKES